MVSGPVILTSTRSCVVVSWAAVISFTTTELPVLFGVIVWAPSTRPAATVPITSIRSPALSVGAGVMPVRSILIPLPESALKPGSPSCHAAHAVFPLADTAVTTRSGTLTSVPGPTVPSVDPVWTGGYWIVVVDRSRPDAVRQLGPLRVAELYLEGLIALERVVPIDRHGDLGPALLGLDLHDAAGVHEVRAARGASGGREVAGLHRPDGLPRKRDREDRLGRGRAVGLGHGDVVDRERLRGFGGGGDCAQQDDRRDRRGPCNPSGRCPLPAHPPEADHSRPRDL